MLEARGVEFAHGSVQVLFGVDLQVDTGEIVALLGTNGAGKSTLLDLVAGLAEPSKGAILLDGDDVTGADAREMVRRGVVLVQGGRGVFPDLTVEENLEVGLHSVSSSSATKGRVAEVLEQFDVLRALRARRAGHLSGGEQQQLAIAKGLVTKPRVLLVDELSLGLAPAVRDQVVAIVREVQAAGTAVVFVEQSLDVAASLTERALFMEKGAVRFDGPITELVKRGDLARAVFLGAGQR